MYDTLLCAYDTVGNSFSFKYDPFGRRIYKSSISGTSVFAYDGDNLVEETNSAGAVVTRYSDGPNIDEPLAMLRSGATSYYHTDGLGSITSLTSASGTIGQTYTFDSFGKLTNSAGSLTNPFRYTAREFDPETNLNFYRARYYDPSIGRFLSEDPIGFNAKQFNFYPYVSNNPARLVDPFGTCPQFDSVTDYHLKCQKIPTVKDRCACHCVYSDQSCFDTCTACWKKDAKPRDTCLCQCNLVKKLMPERLNKSCESFCKVANP